MSNEKNVIKSTVETLFSGMDSFLSTKTVVGDAIHIGDTIILPLVEVTFGVGAGAFNKDAKNQEGGGMGGKMSPCAVLIINNGVTRLINIKEQSGLDKVIDMVPDFVDRFKNFGSKKSGNSLQDETIVDSDSI